MKKTPLPEYVEQHTQVVTAERIGVSQGAISKMLRNQRQVFVVEHDDGTFSAVEERTPGKKKSAA